VKKCEKEKKEKFFSDLTLMKKVTPQGSRGEKKRKKSFLWDAKKRGDASKSRRRTGNEENAEGGAHGEDRKETEKKGHLLS